MTTGPITRRGWAIKHALLAILETDQTTHAAAERFVDAMSWYVDESTYTALLGGFVALPRAVTCDALSNMNVCYAIARQAIPNDAALTTVLAYTAHATK